MSATPAWPCRRGDADGDFWADALDSCPSVANPDQTDSTGDGTGDACAPVEQLSTDGCYAATDSIGPPGPADPVHDPGSGIVWTDTLAVTTNSVVGPWRSASPFRFYGRAYTELFVSSNGFVVFPGGVAVGDAGIDPVPTALAPDGYVAGVWAPQVHDGDGLVRTALVGPAGSRRRVVEFRDYQLRSGQIFAGFRIELYEGSDRIEVHYDEAGASDVDTGRGMAGIESPGGDAGLQWAGAPGGGAFYLAGQAVRYTPRDGATADTDGDGRADCRDNCRNAPNPSQSNVDGDDRGDACECGDQNGDGRVDVNDILAINRAIFGLEPARPALRRERRRRLRHPGHPRGERPPLRSAHLLQRLPPALSQSQLPISTKADQSTGCW